MPQIITTELKTTIELMHNEGFSIDDCKQLVYDSCCKLLLADAHGIYIPQIFAESFTLDNGDALQDDMATCFAGPNEEWYWDAWQSVCDRGTINGKSLYQDGDLWLVDWDMAGDLCEVISELYNKECVLFD